jgi:hypothetical protein
LPGQTASTICAMYTHMTSLIVTLYTFTLSMQTFLQWSHLSYHVIKSTTQSPSPLNTRDQVKSPPQPTPSYHEQITGLELGSANFKQEKNDKATVFEEQIMPLLLALTQEAGLVYDTFWTHAQSAIVEESFAIMDSVPTLRN